MKQIKDIEKAYDLLKQWNEIASRLCGEGLVALKEMERLKIQTKLLKKKIYFYVIQVVSIMEEQLILLEQWFWANQIKSKLIDSQEF